MKISISFECIRPKALKKPLSKYKSVMFNKRLDILSSNIIRISKVLEKTITRLDRLEKTQTKSRKEPQTDTQKNNCDDWIREVLDT